jgi:hypothetical protein
VAAEIEEVVTNTESIQLQHLCENPGEHLFQRAAWRKVTCFVSRLFQAGECEAIDLARRGQGKARATRTPMATCIRQFPSQKITQLPGFDCASGIGVSRLLGRHTEAVVSSRIRFVLTHRDD